MNKFVAVVASAFALLSLASTHSTVRAQHVIADDDRLVRSVASNKLDLFTIYDRDKNTSCGITDLHETKISLSNRRMIIIGDISDVFPAKTELKQFMTEAPKYQWTYCDQEARYDHFIARLEYSVYARVNSPRGESGQMRGRDLKNLVFVGSGAFEDRRPYNIKYRASVASEAYNPAFPFSAFESHPEVLVNGMKAGHSIERIEQTRTQIVAREKSRIERKNRAAAEERRRVRAAREARQAARIAAIEERERVRLASLTPEQRIEQRRVLSIMDQIVFSDSQYWMINRYQRGSMRNLEVSFVKRRDGGFNIGYRADYSYNENGNGWVTVFMNGDRVVCIEYWDSSCRTPYSSDNPNYNGLLATFAAAAIVVAAQSN